MDLGHDIITASGSVPKREGGSPFTTNAHNNGSKRKRKQP
jgi:hypothetical protein